MQACAGDGSWHVVQTTPATDEVLLDVAIQALSAAHRARILRDFSICRTKTSFWFQLPWILFGLAHHNVAKAKGCCRRALRLGRAGLGNGTAGTKHFVSKALAIALHGRQMMELCGRRTTGTFCIPRKICSQISIHSDNRAMGRGIARGGQSRNSRRRACRSATYCISWDPEAVARDIGARRQRRDCRIVKLHSESPQPTSVFGRCWALDTPHSLPYLGRGQLKNNGVASQASQGYRPPVVPC